jgi:hypothetical protein
MHENTRLLVRDHTNIQQRNTMSWHVVTPQHPSAYQDFGHFEQARAIRCVFDSDFVSHVRNTVMTMSSLINQILLLSSFSYIIFCH